MRTIKNLVIILLIGVLLGGSYFVIKNIQEDNVEVVTQNDDSMIPPTNNGEGNQSFNRNEMILPTNESGMLEKPTNETNFNSNAMNEFNRVDRVDIKEFNFEDEHLILLGLSFGVALLVIYLFMSIFNKLTFKETLKNSDKFVILVLASIILSVIIFAGEIYLSKTINTSTINNYDNESTEKETAAEDIPSGENVATKEINLNDYDSNITITLGGEYTLSGEFSHSVIIDSDEDVILNLNNVTIKSTMTSAIANINNNKLTVNLVDGTNNYLEDAGSSEYDGCIFSGGLLEIDGAGNLEVHGRQEEGEGIATDTASININNGNIYIESADDGINAGGDGGTISINGGNIFIKASGDGIDSNQDIKINGGTVYSIGSSLGGDAGIDADKGIIINGGLVIALGSDMLEAPQNTSNQNTICFNLTEKISKGTLVTLINSKDEVIVSFEAKEDFKTLIISSPELNNGTYYLYKNGSNNGREENGIYVNGEYSKGEKINVNNTEEFSITSSITKVG